MYKVGVAMSKRVNKFVFEFPEKPVTPLNRYTDNDLTDFVYSKLMLRHRIYELKYYDNEVLCTHSYIDFTDKTLVCYNYVTNLMRTAFGRNLEPTWADFMEFLEDRCMPRTRVNIRGYLRMIGLDYYDPIEIVQKTNGRMAEDHQWLTLEVVNE